jgi:urease accessory protein
VALILVGVFALFHGYAAGFLLATGLVHVRGIGVGLALRGPLNGVLARGLGGLVAIPGACFAIQAWKTRRF